ncbi:MAG: isocitrate/isopropylmalate family dehydrogenase [Peptostreptococcaceae bacterium]|nr:isocitrate/isopropylmalate family dehydrogenase [Peptostreptococcaceae bacterium]MDY5739866.1 isocitrate/isopropylmalate family dehydrogenase [Anaerovoracaceae bacterium]
MTLDTKIIPNIDREIDKTVNHLRKLLEEQYERAASMEAGTEADKGHDQEAVVIGIAYGDGIGPVIMREAERLLNVILKDEIAQGNVVLRRIEGLTLENRMEHGEAVPKDVLEDIKSCHVLLKGPTTTPKGGSLESANVTLRRELDLFANVRPITIENEGIDWTFFRENTEGEYVLGSRGCELKGDEAELTIDFKITTAAGTKRIARAAMDFARKTGKTRIAIVTKANIMKKTDGMFSGICHQVAKEYPELIIDDWYVDIMAANLVNEELRRDFQVFILPNLYGDIITDEAAQLQGGVGTAGSANIGSRYAMFEAIHGSAPRLVEAGLMEYANPASIFKAMTMMLNHLGFVEKSEALSKALDQVLIKDLSDTKAVDVTDYILQLI